MFKYHFMLNVISISTAVTVDRTCTSLLYILTRCYWYFRDMAEQRDTNDPSASYLYSFFLNSVWDIHSLYCRF